MDIILSLVNVQQDYKKLDPASANAMPLTGDPETDEIVRKQKTINKIKSMKKK